MAWKQSFVYVFPRLKFNQKIKLVLKQSVPGCPSLSFGGTLAHQRTNGEAYSSRVSLFLRVVFVRFLFRAGKT